MFWMRWLAAVTAGMTLSWTAAGAAAASPTRYEVRVDGLACPFCTYGLERKLQSLAGAEEVAIDLERGMAKFASSRAAILSPKRIAAAVKQAGFSMRSVRITLRTAVLADEDRLALVLGGQRVELQQGAALPRLRQLLDEGRRKVRLTVEATARDGRWKGKVTEVKAVGGEPASG